MAILKVAQMGHPILRAVAHPVPPELIGSDAVQAFLADLRETCLDEDGLGLAAPQVHQSIRVVLISIDDVLRTVINPEITFLTDERIATYEGCLSVAGLRAEVERCARVRLVALDEHGKPFEVEAEDMEAVVIQHECDHLDGVLYVDRCDPRTLAFLDEYRRWGPIEPYFSEEE